MTTLEKIKEKLGARATEWNVKNPRRVCMGIEPHDIAEIVAYLFNDLGFRYVIVSGMDTADGIEMLYHFSEDSTGMMFTVCTVIKDKTNPQIRSMTDIIKGISWIEREIHELLGVDFIGHPNLKHLLLPDDWPKNNYPLRHDHE